MTLLDKDLIAQPQLWSLVLMPGDERLDVALIPPVADEEMIWRTFAFDSATPDRRKARWSGRRCRAGDGQERARSGM